jgi:phage FluMu protein Com
MTIRYTCTGCESVLKIKDEKAGTKGKCPKCKAEFLVPQPEAEESAEAAVSSADEPIDEPVDSVDMPIELTPEVPESESFDPLSVLGASAGSSGSRSSRGETSERKPSMAEMMRDFDAAKKGKEKKAASESVRTSAVAASALETAGTAADALSRAYQQKRDSASAPSKSAKDVKAQEERALLTEFITRRALPGLLVAGVLIYGYMSWMNHEPWTGPELFEVTGQVSTGAAPAVGIQVFFEPISSGPEDNRSAVWATTDPGGNFRLMYDASHFGCPAGDYNIGFAGVTGQPLNRAEGALKLTVEADKPNQFKISL